MNCLAYDEFKEAQCTGTAQYPYSACDKACGWNLKKSQHQLKAVLEDKTDWRDVMGGIKNWSVGKYEYYLNLLNN